MIAPSRKRGFFLLFIFICIFFITGCSESDRKAKQQRFTVGLATNNPNGLKNVLGFQEAMTENRGYSHCTKPGEVRPGYVGPPYPDVQQRISEDGEVLVKSPGNMII